MQRQAMAARRKPKKSSKHTPQEPKRGRGRPSDYRPELCEMVRKLALLGLTDEEMADVIGKPIRTFLEWKVKHPEFQQAIKNGKTPADADVSDRLHQRAMGYEWDEQQPIKLKEIRYGENGKKVAEIEHVKIVTVRRVVPPSEVAGIFWLCNRQRDKWRQRQEVTGAGGKPLIPEEPNWGIVRDGIEGKLARIAATGAAAGVAGKP